MEIMIITLSELIVPFNDKTAKTTATIRVMMVFTLIRFARLFRNLFTLLSPFQVCKPVIDHFDLLLYHRHTLGKVIVLSYLPGQFLDFCIRHCLGYLYGRFTFFGGSQAGGHHTCQR